MEGITIKKVKTGEEKHSSDWGFILENSMPQETPAPKVYYVDIPGRHGKLDLTDDLCGLRFNGRHIPICLGGMKEKSSWPDAYSKFLNAYHGQKVEITLDVDPEWYYRGRFLVKGSLERVARLGKLECELDAEPFKYRKASTLEPWKWDPFSFIDGIIRNYGDIAVDGKLEFRVVGDEHNVEFEILLLSGEVSVSFRGVEHPLRPGRNVFYDYGLNKGDNWLTFTGSGHVAIDYKEVSL